MVVVTRADNYVPANSVVHDRRARMLADHVLRASREIRAHVTDDQDLQQRGKKNI